MIDYQLLQALSAVINEGGFEKASGKLFITQSAVSRRIRQLESLLGEPVLIRSQPPEPTQTGKRLLNHLQQVKQLEWALGIDSIQSDDARDTPVTIRLAVNADSLGTWLPEALVLPDDELNKNLQFEFLVEDQSVILKRMKSGEVMACLSSQKEPVNGGGANFLGYLRYRAVASPDFLNRYKVKSMKDLEHCPCLIFDEDDPLQHQFLKDVAEAEPKIMHKCPSADGFKQGMITGLGYGLIAELQIGNAIARGDLVFIDEGYILDVPMYWHYWLTQSPQLAEITKRVMQIAKTQLQQD